MSERITDEKLRFIVECIDDGKVGGSTASCLRELQQRRAADKYATLWHIGECAADQSMADIGEHPPCTCGYDQLPEWIKHGKDAQ